MSNKLKGKKHIKLHSYTSDIKSKIYYTQNCFGVIPGSILVGYSFQMQAMKFTISFWRTQWYTFIFFPRYCVSACSNKKYYNYVIFHVLKHQ